MKLGIDKSVKLPKATHIEIRYRNLLGLRVVNLDPGTGAAPYLSPGDLVPTTQTEGPLDLDTIFNNLRPLLTGINPSDINDQPDDARLPREGGVETRPSGARHGFAIAHSRESHYPAVQHLRLE